MTWADVLPKFQYQRILSTINLGPLSKHSVTRPRSTNLESLKNPPSVGQFKLRNTYIPINRRTLLRELLYDSSIVPSSERLRFEQVASCLGRKFGKEFRNLENEFSVLFHPASSSTMYSPNSTNMSESTQKPVHLRPLTKAELLDREFWLIRRLNQLTVLGGFIEVTRDQLERSCHPTRFDKNQVFTFVDPHDYDVMRFWVRGVHPLNYKSTTNANILNSVGRTSVGLVNRISSALSDLFGIFKRNPSNRSGYFNRWISSRSRKIRSSEGVCFTNVLMAVRGAHDDWLEVKLFSHVPASKASARSNYTDILHNLLPKLHFRSLTTAGRVILTSSCFTALGCIGVVIPLAWLLTTNPDLVIAWSTAAATGAGATASLVWAQHWHSLARTSESLKQLHYDCCRGSGFHAIRSLLQAIVEEEFKSALLTYALLLEATNSGSPISPVQLNVRAESWIAKRLSPSQHISVFPLDAFDDSDLSRVTFTGGSGPLFDLVFDAERSLKFLRQLNLVRGPESSPQAVPLPSAVTTLQTDYGSKDDLDSLWILDPLVDNTVDKFV